MFVDATQNRSGLFVSLFVAEAQERAKCSHGVAPALILRGQRDDACGLAEDAEREAEFCRVRLCLDDDFEVIVMLEVEVQAGEELSVERRAGLINGGLCNWEGGICDDSQEVAVVEEAVV